MIKSKKFLYERRNDMAKAEKVKEKGKSVTPWEPVSEIARMERNMERMFDDFFGPRWSPFRRQYGL
jgi:hypothetical protein